MKKVLIVDDSATQRVILKAIILNFFKDSEFDCTVEECSDGGQALRLLESDKFDLVFTDINMEPISGIDLLNGFKGSKETTPFIFVSSHLTDAMQLKAKELGAIHYITKPLLQEKIEPALREVFRI